MTSGVQLVRSADRFATDWGWLDSRHSFSFGQHYDANNTGFGVLLVSNEDVVAPGAGFETHPHRDMEIVTWVIEGSLVHQDSHGHSGVIYPGLAQRMSAGTGILHSEKNDEWVLNATAVHDKPVHFVQMWVIPDTASLTPSYDHLDISAELEAGGLVPVVSGMPGHDSAIRIAQKEATLLAARIPAGGHVSVPDAAFAHVFVTQGSVELEGAGVLAQGDAARITGAQGQRITALAGPAEVLIWQMNSQF